MNTALQQAANHIQNAEALLITAGAGMGIDSGLPDFRGVHGFWRAFPPLQALGIHFQSMANPDQFWQNPKLAWGFYGWRLRAYRQTVPHQGHQLLQQWAATKPHGLRVFTSNVDGQFQKSGIPEAHITTCHGSIHHLQCQNGNCPSGVWSADSWQPDIDENTCQLKNAPPRCPQCGGIARPNILMFNDWDWQGARYTHQRQTLDHWIQNSSKLVIIEIGAGKAIPTVRHYSERITKQKRASLIRINPDEPQVSQMHYIVLKMGALQALQALDGIIQSHARTGEQAHDR